MPRKKGSTCTHEDKILAGRPMHATTHFFLLAPVSLPFRLSLQHDAINRMDCAPSNERVALTRVLKEQVRETLHAAICDSCGGLIMGNRYLCAVCRDYDLCHDCLSHHTEDHLPAHPLVVIPGGTAKQAPEVQVAVAFAQDIFTMDCAQPTASPLERFVCDVCEPFAGGSDQNVEGKEQKPTPVMMVCGSCGGACCTSCKLCALGHNVALRLLSDDTTRLAGRVLQAKGKLVASSDKGGVESSLSGKEGKEQRAEVLRKLPVGDVRASLKIRLMARNDLNDVLAVEGICFTDPYPLSTFEQLLTQASVRLFVATQRGEEVCGYIIADLGAKRQAKIVSLATRPDCRGNGAASGLLQAALQVAVNKAVSLHVHVDNMSAQRLYQKHGFVVTARMPNYYRQRHSGRVVPRTGDAFTMVCPEARKEQQSQHQPTSHRKHATDCVAT